MRRSVLDRQFELSIGLLVGWFVVHHDDGQDERDRSGLDEGEMLRFHEWEISYEACYGDACPR